MAENNWPPSHAPPPGATPCSIMATCTVSGDAVCVLNLERGELTLTIPKFFAQPKIQIAATELYFSCRALGSESAVQKGHLDIRVL